MNKFAVIIPAAGNSSRFGSQQKKAFVELNGRAVWLHSVDMFANRDDVTQIIVVIGSDDWDSFHEQFADEITQTKINVVRGGAERSDSVGNALKSVHADIDYIAVHDAARPCLPAGCIDGVFAQAIAHGAATLAIPVAATLKQSDDGERISCTVSRECLYEAQTPQAFRRDLLEDSFANRGDFQPTDEAQLLEHAGHSVALAKGSSLNFKITTQADFELAELVILKKSRRHIPR